MTQVYPKYLCERVPTGRDSCNPPRITAENAAYAWIGIGYSAVLITLKSILSQSLRLELKCQL